MRADSDASHPVVQDAKDAGVWVVGGDIDESIPPERGDGDGTVTVSTTADAARRRLLGAAAALVRRWPGVGREDRGACRCAQEVLALPNDREVHTCTVVRPAATARRVERRRYHRWSRRRWKGTSSRPRGIRAARTDQGVTSSWTENPFGPIQ